MLRVAERKGTVVYVVVGKYGPETTEVMAFNERFELDARTEFPTKKLSIVLPKEVPLINASQPKFRISNFTMAGSPEEYTTALPASTFKHLDDGMFGFPVIIKLQAQAKSRYDNPYIS